MSDKKIENNGTIPLEQTTSTIPQDLVNNILRTPYRERLRLIIAELGTGLAGRPEDLQEVLKRAHPGLRETSKTLEILGNQNKIIEDFITDSDTVVAQLERRKRDRDPVHRPGRRDRRGHRFAARPAARDLRQAPHLPRRARADHAPPRRAGRRAGPAPARRPRGGPEPQRVPHPPRAVLPGLPARRPVAGRGLRGGHARVLGGIERGRGAAQART